MELEYIKDINKMSHLITFLSYTCVSSSCLPPCVRVMTSLYLPQQRVSVDSGSEEEQTVTTRIFRRRLILKVPWKPGAEAGLSLGLVWFGLV